MMFKELQQVLLSDQIESPKENFVTKWKRKGWEREKKKKSKKEREKLHKF